LNKYCAREEVKVNPTKFLSSTRQSFCFFILKNSLSAFRLSLDTQNNDTIEEFNVDSKRKCGQLNLAHETKTHIYSDLFLFEYPLSSG